MPSGKLLALSDEVAGVYLYHSSDLGTFSLSSDSIGQSFTNWKRPKHITNIIGLFAEEENEAFRRTNSTIGGRIVFPGKKIGREGTINQDCGCKREIADRFDLTLECIRRHYVGQSSPLGETLARYRDFFKLFEDFRGYVEFFLLEDLVTDNYCAVEFFLPFDDFKTLALPANVAAYKEYRRLSIEFVEARNRRIDRYVALASTALAASAG